MSTSGRVAKNSLWLIAQPILLNLLSLLAIPYIVRALGQADYGRFTLGFAIIAMFTPLSNMGLRSVTVRHVAEDRATARQFASNMLGARCVLAVATVAVIAIVVNLLRYDASTKLVAYLASLTMLSETIVGTLQDVFQAFENMRYVAYARFVGGFILTVLSVAVLLLGFGLIGLTLSYVLGSLLTVGVSWYYARKVIGSPRFIVDRRFLWKGLVEGMHFFYPSLVSIVCSKVGVSLLPLFGGIAAVGAYGAATALIDRLLVFPDGICTAIFPTLAILHKNSPDEAAQLFRRYFEYLFMTGLPIAVGTTILAEPIVVLLFGRQYLSAIPVLVILSWGLFLTFLASLQFWTLGAIHEEKKGARIALIVTPLGVLFNLALIPYFHERGIAWANLAATLVSLVLLRHHIRRKFVRPIVSWSRLVRLVGASALMGLLVLPARKLNIAVPLAVGAVSYPLICLGIGLVSMGELKKLWALVLRRTVPRAARG
jgi:O-antigen/teichoic acid export membrane protein